ncbi:universal stress protein [Tepidibacillus fermentans]|uniref:Nucleotide-binding universal stress UspA family protein n=1 Tax=Tepidibacillus fermentans TaxID=1281767 RepID=A0A4R3KIR0_9BACI|nr:universal stress protein [Tepidibacillus fermentans]TCS83465.1 nucleotide-binding universal stress UspA family protein [Tepidibacillus fermentans]
MNKILFATDGSEYSEHAAKMTKEFLEAWPKATAIVLYVTVKENYAYDLVPNVVDRYEETITRQIENDVKNRLFSSLKDRIQFMHRTGHASITICNVAEEEQVDLIIVGSHGRGFIDRAFLGSVAQGVMHRSSIPVLIVKK